jgi:hypothetical protein
MRAERRLGEMMDEGKPDRAAVGGYRRNDGIPKTPSRLSLRLASTRTWRIAPAHWGVIRGVLRAAGEEQEHRDSKKPDAIPTLVEVGIDKNLAHRAPARRGVKKPHVTRAHS